MTFLHFTNRSTQKIQDIIDNKNQTRYSLMLPRIGTMSCTAIMLRPSSANMHDVQYQIPISLLFCGFINWTQLRYLGHREYVITNCYTSSFCVLHRKTDTTFTFLINTIMVLYKLYVYASILLNQSIIKKIRLNISNETTYNYGNI